MASRALIKNWRNAVFSSLESLAWFIMTVSWSMRRACFQGSSSTTATRLKNMAIRYVNTNVPMTCNAMATAYSTRFWGATSPYPTEVMVMMAK